MASALSKEMGMMEAQLKRWKDAALEAVSLREKAHSLRAELSGKVILPYIFCFHLLSDRPFT